MGRLLELQLRPGWHFSPLDESSQMPMTLEEYASYLDTREDLPWLSVQTRKLRQQIDGLLTQLKDLPSRLRQYAGYEYVRKLLQGYAKVKINRYFNDKISNESMF